MNCFIDTNVRICVEKELKKKRQIAAFNFNVNAFNH